MGENIKNRAKAKIIFIDGNREKEEEAERMGLPKPEPKERKGEIYFRLDYVHIAYINCDNDIVIHLPSGHWILEYDESLWDKIKEAIDKID